MNLPRYPDLTIKRIPTHSPVHPNTVAFLGGDACVLRPIYVVLKDGIQVWIEGPPLDPEATHLPSVEELDNTKLKQLNDEYRRYLLIIEDLTQSIDFGASQMAYLTKDTYGEYCIVHDYRRIMQVSCPMWGPKIYIDDVNITVWGTHFDRHRGIWNGREVDIFYAFQEYDRILLNRVMYVLRHLEGTDCDVTFEFYGHLLDKDETILGYVAEAAWGRNIGLGDEELVSSALKRLESLGCVYRAVSSNMFLVSDGKLRLLMPQNIERYNCPELLKKNAEFHHNWALDELFDEFRNYGSYGLLRLPPLRLIMDPMDVKYLRMLPTPERLFNHSWRGVFLTTCKLTCVEEEDQQNDRVTTSSRRSLRKRRYFLHVDPVDINAYQRGLTISPPSRITNFHPYPRRKKVLQELSSTEGTESIVEGSTSDLDVVYGALKRIY
ncbi:hypothetical protein JR316_0011025 [Psilocybe cubensis]|uniref:Uncharacterized protein n=2 Tax=Psilocybe cubensis TaxID=181762 RepID=A0A8H7XPW2_PSICU|nr:hypothetical protein JR316_0011025 [Psilocybe cubensis]KAH9477109.1 hypothetical protein JR316_0011025 [Psilocybe cubensis]